MVTNRETVLITGAEGYLGSRFVSRYKHLYQFVCLSRNRIDDEGIISIGLDLSSEDIADLLYVALMDVPRPNYIINAAADIRFHAERSEVLCSTKTVSAQYYVNCVVPAVVIAAVFEAHLKDKPMSREPVSVLNISSESAFSVIPGSRQAFYASSKAALNCLTMHLADEYEKYNMRINALAPGSFSDDLRCLKVVEAIHTILKSTDSGRIFRMD